MNYYFIILYHIFMVVQNFLTVLFRFVHFKPGQHGALPTPHSLDALLHGRQRDNKDRVFC